MAEPAAARAPLGAILVGGASRRMGIDKARVRWRGTTLLERAGSVLSPVLADIVVVGGEKDAHGFAGFAVWPDRQPGLGPLGGLATALERAEGRAVFLLACDLPRVTTELVRHLTAPSSGGGPLTARVPRCDGRLQPLCALYAAGCAQPLAEYLAAGERRAIEFLARLETRVVELGPGHPLHRPGLLANVNRPSDLAGLEAAVTTERDPLR